MSSTDTELEAAEPDSRPLQHDRDTIANKANKKTVDSSGDSIDSDGGAMASTRATRRLRLATGSDFEGDVRDDGLGSGARASRRRRRQTQNSSLQQTPKELQQARRKRVTETLELNVDAVDFFTADGTERPPSPQVLRNREHQSQADAQSDIVQQHTHSEVSEDVTGDEFGGLHNALLRGQASSDIITDFCLPEFISVQGEENTIYDTRENEPDPHTIPAMQQTSLEDLHEDGLYIGIPPKVPSLQHQAFVKRVLRQEENSDKWLRSDGKLKQLSDPISKIQLRFDHEEDDVISTSHTQGTEQTLRSLAATLALDEEKKINRDKPDLGILILEINVTNIGFTSHPLFSEEQRLATDLQQLCKLSANRRASNQAELLHDRLQALRGAKEGLSARIQANSITKTTENIGQLRDQIELYQKEIVETRLRRNQEEEQDFTITEKILQTWNDIKQLRATTNMTRTPVSLVMYKKNTNKSEEEMARKQDIRDAVAEEEELYNLELQKKKKRYLNTRAALVLQGQVKDDDMDDMPPALLVPFDTRAAKRREKKFQRRPPGYPILIPELKEIQVTENELCTPVEVRRRELVHKTLISYRVFVNDKHVHQSKAVSLNDTFAAEFHEPYRISMQQRPRSIRIDICQMQGGGITKRPVVLAGIHIPLPSNVLEANTAVETWEFSSNQTMILPAEFENTTNVLNGTLDLQCGWGKGSDIQSQTKNPNQGSYTSQQGVSENIVLDPNDPRNEIFFSDHPTANNRVEQEGVFQLYSRDLADVFLDESESFARRHQLFRLRDREVLGYKSLGPIPLKILQPVEHHIDEASKAGERDPDSDEMDQILARMSEFRRTQQAQYILKMRAQQFTQQKKVVRYVAVTDVVNENPFGPHTPGGLLEAIKNIFAPHRPLKPRRKEPKPLDVQQTNEMQEPCKVQVLVSRAWGLPSRQLSHNDNTVNTTIGNVSLNPVIEVIFQGNVQETSVGSGCSPVWNENLIFSFVPSNNDYTPENLRQCTDKLYFNVYDDQTIDLIQDERERVTDVHLRSDRRWLGQFVIPIFTIISQRQMHGSFQLKLPVALIGYTKSKASDKFQESFTQDHDMMRAYITVDINITPVLDIGLGNTFDETTSMEEETMITHAKKWEEQCTKVFPNRNFEVTALNLEQETVLKTRYVEPQPPPAEIVGNIPEEAIWSKMLHLARFVSMIPDTPDALSFAGNVDIWATSRQLFDTLSGDSEEHAVLLCNYFLTIRQVSAWVVVGYALPEGATAFVLTATVQSTINNQKSFDDSSFLLWNPVSGENYNLNDPFCPLKRIDIVFDNTNVWGNMQPNPNPGNMNFDFGVSKNWKPFFSKSFPRPATLPSIQAPVDYVMPSPGTVSTLEAKVTNFLREKVRSWREANGRITRYNGPCCTALYNLLGGYEQAFLDPEKETGLSGDLDLILKTHNLTGFPINFPYVNLLDSAEKVYSSAAFLTRVRRTELGIAVKMIPYPNDVYSCWVFLAVVSRN
eukprot:m.197200 g.197200  ORF g.197200 m.197200 type:complete len:1490 (+) comp15709_c0_seq4:147-4616(+)